MSDSTAVVVWQTDVAAACTIEYGDAFDASITTADTTQHVAQLGGLQADKRYPYRIRSQGAELAGGAEFFVRTAPQPNTGAEHEFLIWGDSGTGTPGQAAVAAIMNAERPDFAIHVGDIVYPHGEQENYDTRYYQPYAPLLRHTPVWAAIGNHDDTNRAAYLANWYLPVNPKTGSELYYSFDYGDIHFAFLNSNRNFNSEVRAWLRADLAATARRWKIVVVHHALYTCNPVFGPNETAIADLRPIFDEFSVDLVLAGHDHNYQRSYPLYGEAVVGSDQEPNYVSPGGTIYVVTGGGGEARAVSDACWFTAQAIPALHFTRVRVIRENLMLEAVDTGGEIIDRMKLSKSGIETARPLDLLYPDARETLDIGQSVTMYWRSQIQDDVRLELSRISRQGPWEPLFDSTANDGAETWTVSGPPADECWVRLASVNNAAVADTSRTSFRIRNRPLPPEVRIVTPDADANVRHSQNTLDVSGTASDADGTVMRVEYRVQDADWVPATGTSPWSFTITALEVGGNLIEVRALDDGGVASEIARRTITRLEPSPPRLDILAPAADEVVPHDRSHLDFLGFATDADGLVLRIEHRVNGGAWALAAGTETWSFTASLDVGVNRIDVRAIDDEALASDVFTRTIMRVASQAPPIVNIVVPETDVELPYARTRFDLSGTAIDTDGSVLRVECRVRGGAWQEASGTADWTYTLDGLEVGANRIEVRAHDDTGNVSEIIARTLTRHAPIAPTGTITSPSGDESVPRSLKIYAFTGTASDADGAVVRVEYRFQLPPPPRSTTEPVRDYVAVDDAAATLQHGGHEAASAVFGPWLPATGTTTWTFTADVLRPGSSRFEVRVLDDSGLYSPLLRRTIHARAYAVAPSLEVTEPPADVTVPYRRKSVAFAGTAADFDGSVQRVEFRIGNGAWQPASGTENWTFTVTRLAVGTTHVEVRALDFGGLASRPLSRKITRNPHALPTVTIAVPEADVQVAYAAIPEFSGTAADADGSVARVQFRVDAGTWQTVTGTTGWAFTLPTPNVGDNRVDVRAVDDDGFASVVVSRTVTRLPLPQPVPIALEEVAGGKDSWTNIVSTSDPLTGASGHLYLAAVSTTHDGGGSAVGVAEVSGLGLTWTPVREQCSGVAGTLVSLWQALGTPIEAGAVTATLAATAEHAVIAVARYSGVSPAAPIGSIAAANNDPSASCANAGESSAYAVQIDTSDAGELLFGAAAIRAAGHTPGQDAELLELHHGDVHTAGLAIQHAAVELGGAVTLAGTLDRDVDWAAVVVAIRPAWAEPLAAFAPAKVTTAPAVPFRVSAFPNPFNPSTMIRYDLPAAGHVELTIYDASGRKVSTLVHAHRDAGTHTETWRGTRSGGTPVASGVYVARVVWGTYSTSIKLVLTQ